MITFLQNLHLLLPVAVGIMLMLKVCHSQAPTVLECNKNDGDIVIFNSSFWFECEKGRQILKYCVIFADGVISMCVPTEIVVKKQHEYANTPAWVDVLPTFMDTNLTVPHCLLLNMGFSNKMIQFQEKHDCLKDYDDAPISNPNMSPCKIQDRNVFFLHFKAWFMCKDDGSAPIKKCAFKFSDDNRYWCMSTKRIIDLLWDSDYYKEIERRTRSRDAIYFCEDIEELMELANPDYKKELTSCNDETVKYGQAPTPTDIEDTTDPITGKDVYPQYIDCQNPDNAQSIVIDRDSFWRECVNGRLENLYCAFHDKKTYESSYGCITNEVAVKKTEEYYRDPNFKKMVTPCFMDAKRTQADCAQLRHDWPNQMIKFKGGKKKECLSLSEELNDGAKHIWCKIKSKKVYERDEKNGWFTCKRGWRTLIKCVFKVGPRYLCLRKEKIDATWTKKPSGLANDGTFCEAFKNDSAQIYPNYANDLETCEEDVEDDSDDSNEDTDETETETNKSGETETEIDEEAVIPYPGGERGRRLVENCTDDPVLNEDFNCYYKCGMPYMCRVNSGYCLSFYVVEYMFRTYQNENNKNFSRPYGAWNDAKFEKLLAGMDENQHAVYKELKNYKGRVNYYLFETLAQVHQLLLGEEEVEDEDKEESDPDPPQVTIQVGNVATSLEFPSIVTYIVEVLAPFYDDFIAKHTQTCPEVVAYYEYD